MSSMTRVKVELIHGELRMTSPAGPIHDDYINDLTDWSYEATNRDNNGWQANLDE